MGNKEKVPEELASAIWRESGKIPPSPGVLFNSEEGWREGFKFGFDKALIATYRKMQELGFDPDVNRLGDLLNDALHDFADLKKEHTQLQSEHAERYKLQVQLEAQLATLRMDQKTEADFDGSLIEQLQRERKADAERIAALESQVYAYRNLLDDIAAGAYFEAPAEAARSLILQYPQQSKP